MHTLGKYRDWNRRRKQWTWPDFNVPLDTLLKHVHVIGQTGMGKSTFLLSQIGQDIRAGRGCIMIDPKGDLALDVLKLIPPARRRDVIYFAPHDTDFPPAFNPLHCENPDDQNKIASRVLDAFEHLFKDSWGPQLEQILKNALLAVLAMPGGTLLDVKFLITNKGHRDRVLRHVRNDLVRDFWSGDFEEHWTDKEQRDRTLSTLNKISQFITDPMLCNVIRQQGTFSLKQVMDEGKIFVANLDQGKMGENASRLLGGMLVSNIHSAALARKRREFFPVYVDEFHLFGSTSFAQMLSIVRGFGVSLWLAHQYLNQLSPQLQAAVLGTVETTVCFRIGVLDEPQLAKKITMADSLAHLPQHFAYANSTRIYVETCPFKRYPSAPDKIIANSRSVYAKPRARVERSIANYTA